VRAFVSVDVPDPREPPGSEARAHLTLQFFAELAPELVVPLGEAIRSAVRSQRPFPLELCGVGAFPGPERPRVVFAAVGEGAEEVGELARRVEDAAESLGIPRETRPFAAHVTLLRVRGPRDLDEARRWLADGADRTFGRTEVGEVVLNSSELRREGAVHRALGRYPLVGG
jgi:RNA 2',3'-cyclic 3'-phosphodiesterase